MSKKFFYKNHHHFSRLTIFQSNAPHEHWNPKRLRLFNGFNDVALLLFQKKKGDNHAGKIAILLQ